MYGQSFRGTFALEEKSVHQFQILEKCASILNFDNITTC